MKTLLDFDKFYEDYANDWLMANQDRPPKELEEEAFGLYVKWAEAPLKECDGLSPIEYFEQKSGEELMEMFHAYYEGSSVPEILLDAIIDNDQTTQGLKDIVLNRQNDELTVTAMGLLQEKSNTDLFNTYIEWVLDQDCPTDIAEHAIEALQSGLAPISNIDDRLDNVPPAIYDRVADIVAYAEPTKKGFDFLIFGLNNRSKMIYAAYLGKYGMEEAIPYLKKIAKFADKNELKEINNSIMMLGGDVEDSTEEQ